jgi:hypothetical protein
MNAIVQTARCPRCGPAPVAVGWLESRDGGRRLRADCKGCGRFLCWLPRTAELEAHADTAGSPTDLLDVMTRLEDLGITLRSDGRAVWFDYPGCRRVGAELAALVRSCSHRLARLIGRN